MRTPRVPRIATPRALTALFVVITSFLLPAAFGQAAKPTASAPLVELPTLQVTDTRELPAPDKWRYTEILGFEVISDASDRETQRLIRDFEIFRIALDKAYPMEKRPAPPSAIILCGKGKSFDQFVTDGKTGAARTKPTILLNGREQAFILVDLALKSVTSTDITADGSSGPMNLQYSIAQSRMGESGATEGDLSANNAFEINHYKQLCREYVRYQFSRESPPPPVWFEEGIAQIVMQMKVNEREIIIGQLIDVPTSNNGGSNVSNPGVQFSYGPGASSEDPEFNYALSQRKLLKFDEFFGVKRGDEATLNSVGYNFWAKQCAAFLHINLYGWKKSNKASFEKLLARARKAPLTPEIFEECYGKSYDKFLVELSAYIQAPAYKAEQHLVKGKARLDLPPPEMRDATEGESERIKGDALRLAGIPAVLRPTAIAAYIRGERDPQFLGTFGQAELAGGDRTRAEKFLAAAAPKTTRPSVLTDLAQLRLDAASSKPAGPKGKLSDKQAGEILDLLAKARTLSPPLPDTFRLIANTWVLKETPPEAEELTTLAHGLKLFPRDAALVYYTAALNLRLGNHEAVIALASYGEKIATSEAQRGQFTRLKAQIPAPGKS
ncbi:hypothetical protein CMV30_13945 [Nibricoccus aquaticus]|uniref:Uncharacterized protein n=1 Tax=Nibricoccus aquaticus TaxID=2576891 RepID=A0A290QI18_9BACT|nr:hypothetical protein [Nibricoccus aquaticus]ATC64978.1 hypothetical protein CMV30_13945 [Nibricoccus aquaticus]